MRCKCGFENAADAKFCGSCRTALGRGLDSGVSAPAAPSTAPPAADRGKRSSSRRLSRASITTAVVVLVAIVAGYWWINRPAPRYKPDNGGLYPISANGKYGYMDRTGKTVIPPQFDAALDFSEGLAVVKVGTKYGYTNTQGTVVITPQFEGASRFQQGRAAVKLGKTYGFVDTDGKYISSPTFSWAGMFSGNLAPVKTADGKCGFVDRSGKLVPALLDKCAAFALRPWLQSPDGTTDSGFTEGLAPVASGETWGYIDTAGKWIINPQFEAAGCFGEGLAPVTVGRRTGYIDRRGKFVINPQYDQGDEFYEGCARFSEKDKFGFIDKTGRVVVEAKFLKAGHFSDGLAPVKTDDGWGFIDQTGKLVITPQFDMATHFQNELAFVRALGKEAYITKTGAFVVNPFPGTTLLEEKKRIASLEPFAGKWELREDNGPRCGSLVVTRLTGDQYSVDYSWCSDIHLRGTLTLSDGQLTGSVKHNNLNEVYGCEVRFLDQDKKVLSVKTISGGREPQNELYKKVDRFSWE